MLQSFRSFQWAALLPLLGLAAGLRLVILAVGGPTDAAAPGASDGAWARAVVGMLTDLDWVRWGAGVLAVTFVGFVGSVTLQRYRLAVAGTVPTLVSIALGSALVAWLDFDPRLLAAVAIALAAHQLYNAYRQQTDALPVFNTGLYVGVAWLLHASFVWFALWALVALIQLRKIRGSDLLSLAIGLAILPALWLAHTYVFGDLASGAPALWQGAFAVPTVADLRAAAVPLAILATVSLMIVFAYGTLTTRRPVQEQRAHRMWYSLLFFGWLAMVLSGGFGVWPVAYVLAPLSVLLGVWLIELPRKPSDAILITAVVCILGGYAFAALA